MRDMLVNPFIHQPMAGVMVPLFSIRTSNRVVCYGNTLLEGDVVSGGCIGEILDMIPFINFMEKTGLSILQILPMNELAPDETSPYNALSGFARDPIYLSLDAWDDLRDSQEPIAFPINAKYIDQFEKMQKSPTVCYEKIRAFKSPLFKRAFERFKKEEWGSGSRRDQSFRSFMEEEAFWLEDYALFRYLKEKNGGYWTDWPISLRKRYPVWIARVKEEAEAPLLFIKYLQWAISEQWASVRGYAREKKILIMGDIPFLISPDSADVWSRQKEFCLDSNGIPSISVGAPPDYFNQEGQAWGLPMFSWNTMEQSGFQWWRERIRKARKDFDMIRLDHIVGFFRVWVFPQNGAPHFEPKDEERQKERGRFFLQLLREEAGDCMLVAEDLGVIPPFVREQMNALRIPGIKVLRWEKKEWNAFIPPEEFPALSLATTGTHDTSTLAFWWNEISNEERSQFLSAFDHKGCEASLTFSDAIHQLILLGLMKAGSDMVIVPIQDILGETDHINVPGTVSAQNWRYRIPENVEALSTDPRYKDKIGFLKSIIVETARSPSDHAVLFS